MHEFVQELDTFAHHINPALAVAMNQDPLRLTSVEPRSGQSLRLTYQDGQTFKVDLSEWIAHTRVMKPLADPALFAQARLGDWGTSVVWVEDELELGADNLRHLAIRRMASTSKCLV